MFDVEIYPWHTTFMTLLLHPPGRHHSQARVAYALRKSHHARARGARRAPKMPILKSWQLEGPDSDFLNQLAIAIGQMMDT